MACKHRGIHGFWCLSWVLITMVCPSRNTAVTNIITNHHHHHHHHLYNHLQHHRYSGQAGGVCRLAGVATKKTQDTKITHTIFSLPASSWPRFAYVQWKIGSCESYSSSRYVTLPYIAAPYRTAYRSLGERHSLCTDLSLIHI